MKCEECSALYKPYYNPLDDYCQLDCNSNGDVDGCEKTQEEIEQEMRNLEII